MEVEQGLRLQEPRPTGASGTAPGLPRSDVPDPAARRVPEPAARRSMQAATGASPMWCTRGRKEGRHSLWRSAR